jgi:hypothetical protein
MFFVDFLMFLISSAGLTAIIVGSHILSVPRNYFMSKSESLEAFLSCPMCVGFWVGLALSFLSVFNINFFIAALCSSFFSWAAYTFVDAASSVASYFDNIELGEE